jgi:hypothetical protein
MATDGQSGRKSRSIVAASIQFILSVFNPLLHPSAPADFIGSTRNARYSAQIQFDAATRGTLADFCSSNRLCCGSFQLISSYFSARYTFL